MKTGIPFLLVILVGVLLGLTPEVDTLRPGHSDLDTQQVPLGLDTLAVLMPAQDSLRIVAVLTLHTKFQQRQEALLIRGETMFGLDGSILQTDSFAVSKSTLAPRYQKGSSPEGATQLSFDDESAFYDNTMDIILGALPLEEGYAASLALIGTDGPAVAQIHVGALGSIQSLEGIACVAWPITVATSATAGTYWIAEDSRALIRYVPRDGSFMVARLRGCALPV